MKRYCKNIDISDRDFINKAVHDCLRGTTINGHKYGTSKIGRNKTIGFLARYSDEDYKTLKQYAEHYEYWHFEPPISKIVDEIQSEIIAGEYHWKPIKYSVHKDRTKERLIGIEDVKQQFYDYIAVEGLSDIFRRIGEHQYAALPGRGQLAAANKIKAWMRKPDARYAWKGDAKHYFQNIDREILMRLLRKYVKNEPLLDLTEKLIYSHAEGLSIGSYLSQYLANLYMSFAYHYAEEQLWTVRNSKRDGQKRKPLVAHVLIYMDDILFIGPNLRYLQKAVARFRKWMWDELRIKLKPGDDFVCLFHGGYVDMVGYVASKAKMIVRAGIFRRQRRIINKVRRQRRLTPEMARSIISRDGWLKHAQTGNWRRRYDMEYIVRLCKRTIKGGKNVYYRTRVERGVACA